MENSRMQGFSSEEKLKKILIEDYGYSVEELDICNGIMGVPISFLDKYCPEQFEIIGVFNHGSDHEFDFAPAKIKGVEKFKRIAVRFLDSYVIGHPGLFEIKNI